MNHRDGVGAGLGLKVDFELNKFPEVIGFQRKSESVTEYRKKSKSSKLSK